jgi:hypothetical protein
VGDEELEVVVVEMDEETGSHNVFGACVLVGDCLGRRGVGRVLPPLSTQEAIANEARRRFGEAVAVWMR